MVMSLIESLTRIKNAVYGREVREAIHDGVFRANQIADGADTKADNTQIRQDAVEVFNNQVVQEMTDMDVISAPEIIAARGGKPTLQARLDETTSQLAQIAILPIQFGAVGDGVADDWQAIYDANEYARVHGGILTSSQKHYLSNSITLNADCNLGSSEFIFDGSHSEALIIKGVDAGNIYESMIMDATMELPKVTNRDFNLDYPLENQVGIAIKGAKFSKMSFGNITGFKTAIKISSIFSFSANENMDDFTWNDVLFGPVTNCETAVHLEQKNDGYVNSNTFRTSMATQHGNTDKSVNVQLFIDSEKAGATGIDSNTFINCSYERSNAEHPIEVVKLVNATYNTFVGCRWEIYNGNKILLDGGWGNIFMGGYGLHPAHFNFVRDPKYRIITREVDQGTSKLITNGLDSLGNPVTVKDFAYPIIGDNKISGGNLYRRWESSGTSQVGEQVLINDILAFRYYTQLANEVGYTYLHTGMYEINTTSSLVIKSPIATVNGKHIQVADPFPSASRPTSSHVGRMIYDTNLGKPLWWSGTNWRDASGTAV